MSTNAQLFVLAGRFFNGQTRFDTLVEWIGEREEHWQAYQRVLADTIMLAAYKVEAGVRDEDGTREVIAEASLESSPVR